MNMRAPASRIGASWMSRSSNETGRVRRRIYYNLLPPNLYAYNIISRNGKSTCKIGRVKMDNLGDNNDLI